MKLRSLTETKKKTLVNFRVTSSDLKKIQKKADQYTDGNMSEWVRYAAIKLIPPMDDIDNERLYTLS